MTDRHHQAIPEGWDTVTTPRQGMIRERSFSYYPYSQVSSALQKSIRRSLWPEAAFWFLDAYRTGPKCQTNMRKRMLIYCSEDIGPAHPGLIVTVDDLLEKNTLTSLLQAIYLMASAYKDRTLDWMCCAYSLDVNDVVPLHELASTLTTRVHELYNALTERRFNAACYHTCYLFGLYMHHKNYAVHRDLLKRWKTQFHSRAKIYNRIGSLVWLPILGHVRDDLPQSIQSLVHRLYVIACERSGPLQFRNKGTDGLLFAMHAIYALCFPNRVSQETETTSLSLLDDTALITLADEHRDRTLHYDMPDYAIDRHTTRHVGVPKRGRDHFIHHGSRLYPCRPDSIDRQRRYLLATMNVWKQRGWLPQDVVLPDDYYESTLEEEDSDT